MFPTYPEDGRRPSKTHRGRRAIRPTTHVHADGTDHMGEANTHLKAAHKDPTKPGTMKHLFRALNSLKKAK